MSRHKINFKFDEKGDASGPSIDEQLLFRIVEIINDEPYSSTRQIAKVLNENRSTVWRYLTVNLGLVYKRSLVLAHLGQSSKTEQKGFNKRTFRDPSKMRKTAMV